MLNGWINSVILILSVVLFLELGVLFEDLQLISLWFSTGIWWVEVKVAAQNTLPPHTQTKTIQSKTSVVLRLRILKRWWLTAFNHLLELMLRALNKLWNWGLFVSLSVETCQIYLVQHWMAQALRIRLFSAVVCGTARGIHPFIYIVGP